MSEPREAARALASQGAAVAATVLLGAGCSAAAGSSSRSGQRTAPSAARAAAPSHPGARLSPSLAPASPSVAPAARAVRSASPGAPSGVGTGTAPSALALSRPLAGKVVGIDAGHNGGNGSDPGFINHLIWNGRELETCDTTGATTDGGYSEARFNFRVARYLTADLRAAGAQVVLTRTTSDGVGPCVTTRARILDRAHADVAIDIHADGGPPDGRGFTVLEPVADGPNDGVIASSKAFGRDLLRQYRRTTGMPESTYDGTNGVSLRDDLAGLNLTTVPKVLIECGNMRNAADAARLVSPAFQRLAAQAFARAITQFLAHRR